MKQLSLFDDRPSQNRTESLQMDADALARWKERIGNHQRKTRQAKPPQQGTLFALPRTAWETPDELDPFSLRQHPADFYRHPPIDTDCNGCIYFVIDRLSEIILYIGETKLSARQRWWGEHYAKGYTMSYIELHRKYKLDVAVCSAFWVNVPPDKKILLQWERELIFKWRSPFNREMWEVYGQPFQK
ncbi:MAG: hypothetical protein N5P05_004164 (plasmid) [Chroococcopsis gigantea SAG 12.99]|jgi:hypothetical protein|nr:hypothetical protein [Chroococcopsis gigantea SAG 12.99]